MAIIIVALVIAALAYIAIRKVRSNGAAGSREPRIPTQNAE